MIFEFNGIGEEGLFTFINLGRVDQRILADGLERSGVSIAMKMAEGIRKKIKKKR